MNSHSSLYATYIEFYGLRDEVVKILCKELSTTQWVATFLQNDLYYLFESNPAKMKELKETAATLEATLPPNISALHSELITGLIEILRPRYDCSNICGKSVCCEWKNSGTSNSGNPEALFSFIRNSIGLFAVRQVNLWVKVWVNRKFTVWFL